MAYLAALSPFLSPSLPVLGTKPPGKQSALTPLLLCLVFDRLLSTFFPCHLVVARSGDEHAMLELTDVQLPKRVYDGGLGHPAVVMAHFGTGDARLPNQGTQVRPVSHDDASTVDADPFPRLADKKLSACSIMASRTT